MSAWKGRAVITGPPQPKGSQKPVTRPGVPYTVLVSDNQAGVTWAKALSRLMQETAPESLITGPVAMRVTMYLPRPTYHYRTGRFSHVLREDAPTLAPAKPDGEKVERNIFDSGTGVWYVDDKQIVAGVWRKMYDDGNGARTVIECEEIR